MTSSIANKKQLVAMADSLSKKTRFSKQECEGLLNLYKKYSSNRKVDRTVFRDILTTSFEITDDVILDRVFKGFDKDNDGYISPPEWVQGMSVFLRGNIDEQRQFCFDVFDMNNDGFISRDEMFHLLKHCIVKQQSDEDADEGVKDIVDIVLKKMDKDHDARISKAEYWSTVEEDDLLLEAFGQCLPSEKCIKQFIRLFEKNSDQQDIIHG